jgi:hypothetical protein
MDRSFNGQYCVLKTFIFDTARFISESPRFLGSRLWQKPSHILLMQKRCLLSAFATGTLAPLQLFALMWFSADILGLFSSNVFPFSRNVVLSALSFLANVVRKSGCFWARRFMFSCRYM